MATTREDIRAQQINSNAFLRNELSAHPVEQTRDTPSNIEINLNQYPEKFRNAFIEAFGTKKLSLIKKNINDEEIVNYIVPFLNTNPNITTLDVSNNQIEAVGAMALAENQTLTILNVSINRIGVAGAVSLAGNKTLTTLNVSNNQIETAGAVALAGNQTLMTLNVSNNQIGAAGAAPLAGNKTLTTLNTNLNEIGDAGAAALAENRTITTLDVGGNRIGDAGAVALAKNQTLTTLNVCYNRIGDVGAVALADNQILTTLNVKSNRIGNTVTKALLQVDNAKKNGYAKTKYSFLSLMTLTKNQSLNAQKQQGLLFQYRAGINQNRLSDDLFKLILSYNKPKPFKVIV